MSNTTLTYRTVGSAALKPEYSENRARTASIIDFESIVDSPAQHRVHSAPRKLSLIDKAVNAMRTDPLLSSLDKAFIKHGKVEKSNRAMFVRCVSGISLVYLALILLGV